MAWYNERCHQVPDGDIPYWRCKNCSLWHFWCVKCKQFKTIPDEWETSSLWTLNQRKKFLESNGWICDPCWFAFREKIRVVPKIEPKKIYVHN